MLVSPPQPPKLFNNLPLIHSLLSSLRGGDSKRVAANSTSVSPLGPLERLSATVAECLGVGNSYNTDLQACTMEVDVYVDAIVFASHNGFGANKTASLLKLVHQVKESIVSTQDVAEAKDLFRQYLVFNAGASVSEGRALTLFESVVAPFAEAFRYVGRLHAHKNALTTAQGEEGGVSGGQQQTNGGGGVRAAGFMTPFPAAVAFANAVPTRHTTGGKPLASFAVKKMSLSSEPNGPSVAAEDVSATMDRSMAEAGAGSVVVEALPNLPQGSKPSKALSPREAAGGGSAPPKKAAGGKSGGKGGSEANSLPEGFALSVQAATVAFGDPLCDKELSVSHIEGMNPLELAAFLPVLPQGALTAELWLKIASAFRMPADPDPSIISAINEGNPPSSSSLPESFTSLINSMPSVTPLTMVEYANTTASSILAELDTLTTVIGSLTGGSDPEGVFSSLTSVTSSIARKLTRFVPSTLSGDNPAGFGSGSGGGLGNASLSQQVGLAVPNTAVTSSFSSLPIATNSAALCSPSGFGYYIGTGNLTGTAAILLDEESLAVLFADAIKFLQVSANRSSEADPVVSSRAQSLQPPNGVVAAASTSRAPHPLISKSETCFLFDLHPDYFDTNCTLVTTSAPRFATPEIEACTKAAQEGCVGEAPTVTNNQHHQVIETETHQVCSPAAMADNERFLTSIARGGRKYFSLDELSLVGRYVSQGLLQPWRLFALVGQFHREELFVPVEEGSNVEPVSYVMTDEREHPLLRTTSESASQRFHHNNRSPFARARHGRHGLAGDDIGDAVRLPTVSTVPLSNVPPSREPCSHTFVLALQTPLPSHPLKDAVTLEHFEKHYASEQALARQELLELQEKDRQEREAEAQRLEEEETKRRLREEEEQRATLYLEKVEATTTVTRLYDAIEGELGDRQTAILRRILALEKALQLESPANTPMMGRGMLPGVGDVDNATSQFAPDL